MRKNFNVLIIKNFLFFFFIFIPIFLISQTSSNWLWATSSGGSGEDTSWSVVTDNDKNIYFTGFFKSTSITFGDITLTNSGDRDIFVAKLDSEGNYLWAKSIGGNDSDSAYSIVRDNENNFYYITGQFRSEQITFGEITLLNLCPGNSEIFIAKMDSNGNWLWAKSAGGYGGEIGRDLSIDSEGNVYLVGFFNSYQITFGNIVLTNTAAGSTDVYIVKMDGNGNWIWAKSAGGNGYDLFTDIAIDDRNNIYISGYFQSSQITFGNTNLINIQILYPDIDPFIVKMDSEGDYLWAKSINGTEDDLISGVITDNNGNCYFTGYFSDYQLNFGNITITNQGDEDIFIVKMDSEGNYLWVKNSGGNYIDIAFSITIDTNSNIYITGEFMSSELSFGNTTLYPYGASDIFVAQIDTEGNWLNAESAGGFAEDITYAITTDNENNCYITGYFKSSQITFGDTTLSNAGGGHEDIFLAKLNFEHNLDMTENEVIFPNYNFKIFPNPFNPKTTISFNLAKESFVNLSVYNMKGQKIKTLLSGNCHGGYNSIVWLGEDYSGKSVSSGIYLFKLKISDNKENIIKGILIK